MSTFHVHISGQVQGVGFRPLVHKLAHQMQLKGWISNSSDGVHIEVNASESVVRDFVDCIIEKAPPRAKIEKYTIRQEDTQVFADFTIIESARQGNREIRLSPDFAMCSRCENELLDTSNYRHFYPFITCTNCGPRYSIQIDTPFDRVATSMKLLEMCEVCLREYANPNDIRFYSQTNSCKQCGIKIFLYDASKKKIDTKYPIQIIRDAIIQGKTVAVKGIGGFVLMCDATNADAIQLLRKRKNRPTKPFALLYPNIASLLEDANIKEGEINLLTNSAAPIVLVEQNKKQLSGLKTQLIAPNLNKLGVMIPYAPVFKLIAEAVGKPMIATSGNLSSAPITYKDEEAITKLSAFADMIVTNDREIINPQDDSVAQLIKGKLNLVRRSRGYAPSYFGPVPKEIYEGVVAMGADLKATVAISHHKQWYISQFLGNQEQFESQDVYQKVMNHLLHLSGVNPGCILVDKHPMYFTSQLGRTWSEVHHVSLVTIQHHEAHFAAVLQENDLMNNISPVMGVVWDGTGYGLDGNSWGGEFFKYDDDIIHRVSHLSYVPLILGDKMAKEPRISALACCYGQLEYADDLLRVKFSKREFELYRKMLDQPKIFTSSMGRLFDAVASLIGLCDKSTYEGEAAMYLQHLASSEKSHEDNVYSIKLVGKTISTTQMMNEIIKELEEGVSKSLIALKFHCTLVELIKCAALKMNCRNIAFSGGVFQNSLLVELIEERLTNFNLYFHKELSPNDENISFGQLAHYHMQCRKLKENTGTYEVPDRI